MNISKSVKKIRIPANVIYALVVVLILISAINISTLIGINSTITEKNKAFEEENGPVEIELTLLSFSDCEDCYDLDQVLDQIRGMNVKIEKEEELQWDSPEAQSLINKYGINLLPTVIIIGETKKQSIESSWSKIGEMKDDGTVIFTKQELPYYDVGKQAIVGLVTVTTLIDPSCTQCANIEGVVDAFKDIGVAITDERTLDYDSQESKTLIEKFGIREIPTLIISGDLKEYDAVNQIWDQLNVSEKDGFYILHIVRPPYRSLETGEIEGLVELVNLVDSSCSGCYDVLIHEPVIQGFGVVVENTNTYDINSTQGKALVKKYNITKVPTILLSPEVSVYTNLNSVWPQVGSVENDGWHVFRELSALGDVVYTDIE